MRIITILLSATLATAAKLKRAATVGVYPQHESPLSNIRTPQNYKHALINIMPHTENLSPKHFRDAQRYEQKLLDIWNNLKVAASPYETFNDVFMAPELQWHHCWRAVHITAHAEMNKILPPNCDPAWNMPTTKNNLLLSFYRDEREAVDSLLYTVMPTFHAFTKTETAINGAIYTVAYYRRFGTRYIRWISLLLYLICSQF